MYSYRFGGIEHRLDPTIAADLPASMTGVAPQERARGGMRYVVEAGSRSKCWIASAQWGALRSKRSADARLLLARGQSRRVARCQAGASGTTTGGSRNTSAASDRARRRFLAPTYTSASSVEKI